MINSQVGLTGWKCKWSTRKEREDIFSMDRQTGSFHHQNQQCHGQHGISRPEMLEILLLQKSIKGMFRIATNARRGAWISTPEASAGINQAHGPCTRLQTRDLSFSLSSSAPQEPPKISIKEDLERLAIYCLCACIYSSRLSLSLSSVDFS